MSQNCDIKSIVFDLDGTLMMSNITIYKSTLKTLEEFNIPHELTEAAFTNKIGYHFRDIFEDFKIVVSDLEVFIEKYKSYYFDFIDDSSFYPNVFETLDQLLTKGIPVSLLTTKSQDQTEAIIEHFKIGKYFKIIMGRRKGIPVKPAPDSLLYICSQLKINPESTLMIGDSELDIRCAKNAGAISCGVLYGYRDREVLENERPDYLIADIKKLLEIIK